MEQKQERRDYRWFAAVPFIGQIIILILHILWCLTQLFMPMDDNHQ